MSWLARGRSTTTCAGAAGRHWTGSRASPPTTSPTWRRRWRLIRRAPTAAPERRRAPGGSHAREEVDRSLPGQRGRAGVVADRDLHVDRGLVAEGVFRLVAMDLKAHAGSGELLLQRLDARDREERILGGEVTEQRRLALARVQVFERRIAVPVGDRVGLGNVGPRQQRQRAAHAEAVDAHLAAGTLEVNDRPADVLA